MKTVVRMKFGSHLYGTNTPESDLDFKAIHVPSGRDILLQRAKGNVGANRPKAEGEKNLPGEYDEENFSLQRYLELLAGGQTVALDMLFAPDEMLLASSPTWRYIYENRSKLLTKRSAAFVGYCRQQANKYGIKGSRVASAKNAMEFFNACAAEGYGYGPHIKVGETPIYQLRDEHTEIVEKETTQGRTEKYLVCCNKMVGLNNTVKEAAAIFTRIYENYGDRARKAQSNEGVDWKALSHAVRVGHEALELLTTHHITFPLPNAAHVLDIKKGRLPYETVAEEIEQLLDKVEVAAETSTLPNEADKGFIEDLVLDAHKSAVILNDPSRI